MQDFVPHRLYRRMSTVMSTKPSNISFPPNCDILGFAPNLFKWLYDNRLDTHHPMDEEERCWMQILDRVFGDDLQFHGFPRAASVRCRRRITASLKLAVPLCGKAL